MAKLTIKIEMDNAAFDDGADGAFEVARILIEYAERLKEYGELSVVLHDVNGNAVGEAGTYGRRR
jgi:hypothetical protein